MSIISIADNLTFKQTSIIGGTFDTLHQGHKEYISIAFRLAKNVNIFLSTNEFIKNRKQYHVKSFDARKDQLDAFLKKSGYEGRYRIHQLASTQTILDFCENHHNIGFALVVPEYYKMFQTVNSVLQEKRKTPFIIMVKPRSQYRDGTDINSTRVHSFEKRRFHLKCA